MRFYSLMTLFCRAGAETNLEQPLAAFNNHLTEIGLRTNNVTADARKHRKRNRLIQTHRSSMFETIVNEVFVTMAERKHTAMTRVQSTTKESKHKLSQRSTKVKSNGILIKRISMYERGSRPSLCVSWPPAFFVT